MLACTQDSLAVLSLKLKMMRDKLAWNESRFQEPMKTIINPFAFFEVVMYIVFYLARLLKAHQEAREGTVASS